MDSNFDHPDSKVFDWVGSDDTGRPYYLQPLNLSWGIGSYMELALKRFWEVAGRLQSEPCYWTEILRTQSWRHTLIGCVCVLITHHDSHFHDLAFNFEQGNWVSPQIAVTIGIVYPDIAREYFSTYLTSAEQEGNAKQLVSAQCILKQFGVTTNRVFQWATDRDKLEALTAVKIVDLHWSFWSSLSLDFLGQNCDSESHR